MLVRDVWLTVSLQRNVLLRHSITTLSHKDGSNTYGSLLRLRVIDPKDLRGYTEEIVDISELGDTDGMKGAHGGGDIRLIKDFCDVLEGAENSISCTEIMDSTKSHYVVFKAEEARKSGRVITLSNEN